MDHAKVTAWLDQYVCTGAQRWRFTCVHLVQYYGIICKRLRVLRIIRIKIVLVFIVYSVFTAATRRLRAFPLPAAADAAAARSHQALTGCRSCCHARDGRAAWHSPMTSWAESSVDGYLVLREHTRGPAGERCHPR